MPKWILPIALLFPLAAAGEGMVTIAPQQCVWHAGDNPAWAAPSLDESGWQSLTSQNMPYQAHSWLRCHIQLDSLRSLAHPAISVTVYAAYQEFFEGRLIAQVGNLRSGDYSQNIVRIQALTSPLPVSRSAVIALRMATLPPTYKDSNSFDLTAGDASELDALRDQAILQDVKLILPYAILYCIVGVVGFVQLGLFFYDRTRRDLLLLSLFCIATAVLRVNALASSALLDYPNRLYEFLFLLGNFGFVAEVIFFFSLARKRIPWFIWALYALSQLGDTLLLAQMFLSPELAQRAYSLFPPVNLVALSSWTVLTLAPFVAFWPWNRISSRLRPLALCCFLWALCDFVYFALQTVVADFMNRLELYQSIAPTLFEVRALVSGFTVLLILALLFRDQRRITEERAELAGEMASAREIQQYLIPEKLPPTAGLAISSVYLPAREVGGDFFQVLPDPRDGSTLIVLGDVAGKGLKAGMLAALIVGSIRTAFQFTSDPGRILTLLNERLQGRGLVTCLAMRIDSNGNAELANAGHLPPYINGRELMLEGALPLGALPGVSFPSSRRQLREGESMLLVSDGVVEARGKSGELFGFDRTRDLSTQSAQSIARAASTFGQEDDITVLTLTLAPAGAVHA